MKILFVIVLIIFCTSTVFANESLPLTIPPDAIPAGAAVAVRLLTSTNAPIDGRLYPVLLETIGKITSPDGSTLDVITASDGTTIDMDFAEMRMIAESTGSEADSRALFELRNLVIRTKDGQRIVTNVNGWIVGEDTIRGMKGKVIDSSNGLYNRLKYNRLKNTPSESINSAEMSYSGKKALIDAINKGGIVDVDTVPPPVVEVLSGREGTAIFSLNCK